MIQALTVAGALLCASLLAFMAVKPKRVIGDGWISVWLGLHLAYFSAFGVSQFAEGPILAISSLFAQYAAMLFAPVQYLHVNAATRADFGRALRRAAIAFVGATALLGLFLALAPQIERGALIVEGRIALWLAFLPPAAMLATLYYPLASLSRLNAYRNAAKQRLSNLESAGLGWIRIWVISTIVMLGIQLSVFLVAIGMGLPLALHLGVLLTAQCVQIAWAGFHGINTEGVFRIDPSRMDSPALVGREDLAAARADFTKLVEFIDESEPHLDSRLTTGELAGRIGWSPERLHRAIRLGGETRFHDLINRARIRTLEALVRDPRSRRVSLLALAHDSGFGSKSALYEAFQSLEQTSPAQWRKIVEQL